MSPLVEWLLENGGPTIRCRTATELLDDPASADLDGLRQDLVSSTQVMSWLERLTPGSSLNQVHSSKATAYENAMGKLVQLGCRSGMGTFDERTRSYRNWMAGQVDLPGFDWSPFMQMVVGSFLAAGGYHQDSALNNYLVHRLNTLWRFTRKMDYDIYTSRADYPDIPAGFRNKPLVKPELYAGGEEQFPTIYDIYALANFPDHLKNEDAQRKINTVITYILHPDYQSLPDGYGILRAGKGKYYSIGWSVHLPGYRGLPEDGPQSKSYIQRLLLMAHFPVARSHRWFRENLTHLESFRTDQGTFRFPRPYLQERKSGYWVTGAYMGLEDVRRKRLALELESTFWMLKIKKTAAITW